MKVKDKKLEDYIINKNLDLDKIVDDKVFEFLYGWNY